MVFSDYYARRLQPIDSFWGGGGGGLDARIAQRIAEPRSGGGGGGGASIQPAPAPPIDFDFDLSQLGPTGIGRNTRADILSAYEVFTTGTSRGRGLGYAQDVQRRFGAPSLRHGAASYLDAAGLPRLARIVSPTPTPSPLPDSDDLGDFFGLPVLPDPASPAALAQKGPVELLLDALPRLFGNATVSSPLQSQATGYTPVSGDFGGGSGVGGNIGVWLLLGGVGIAAYFIYKRYKASN